MNDGNHFDHIEINFIMKYIFHKKKVSTIAGEIPLYSYQMMDVFVWVCEQVEEKNSHHLHSTTKTTKSEH